MYDNETTRIIAKVHECRAEALAANRIADLCEACGSESMLIVSEEYRTYARGWSDLADQYELDLPAVCVN